MGAQRVQLQPAFVLHRRPYRETSWLLEVFSRDHGRVGLVARAARQARPRAGLSLEPAQELLLTWTLRGELGLLLQSERVSASCTLGGEQLLSALYLNELLLRLITRHDPHPVLFDLYRATIEALAFPGHPAVPLRRFEKQLLQELGYGLNLDRDSDGRPIRAEAYYHYHVGQGACLLVEATTEGAIQGAVLLALRDDQLNDTQSRGEAKRLLRAALRSQLGEKPLQTPALFRSLRGLSRPAGSDSLPDTRP